MQEVGKIAFRKSWKRSCLGLEYISNSSRFGSLVGAQLGWARRSFCVWGWYCSHWHVYRTMCKFGLFILGEVGNFCSSRVIPCEHARSPNSESHRVKLLRDGCACVARVKLGMRNVRRVHLTDIWSWYRVTLRVGDHLGSVWGASF